MEKAFGCKTKGRVDSNRVYMNGLKDIPTPSNPWKIVDHGGRVLARDVNGQTIGIEKKVGKGVVRFFGFSLNYTIEEHPALWSHMMELPRMDRNVWADNDTLHVEMGSHGNEGVLFIGDFHRMPMSATSGFGTCAAANRSTLEPRGSRACMACFCRSKRMWRLGSLSFSPGASYWSEMRPSSALRSSCAESIILKGSLCCAAGNRFINSGGWPACGVHDRRRHDPCGICTNRRQTNHDVT